MIVERVTECPDALPRNDNYVLYCCSEGDGKVYFSACQMGAGMSIHICADRAGKRVIRRAVDAFCNRLFREFEWCRMIIAVIGSESVINLAKKCNFRYVATREGMTVMARAR